MRNLALLALGRITPVDDGERRYTRLIQSAFAAIGGRGIGLIVSLLSVPLTIGYLGDERYGVWITISTTLAWFQIADLGLGNGLTNGLSKAYGDDNKELARRHVSTVFFMLLVTAIVMAVVSVSICSIVDWSAVFGMRITPFSREITPALILAVLLTAAGLPLNIVDKSLGAYQEGAISNLWASVGNLLGFVGLVFVVNMQGTLSMLVAGVYGPILMTKFVCAIWLFTKHKTWLMPSVKKFNRSSLRLLAISGAEFFLLQVAVLVLYQSDNLVLARFVGAQEVANYSVVYRLFAYVTLLHAILVAPLWPAYAEAHTRNDSRWIADTFKRNFIVSICIFYPIIAILLVTANPIIHIWTRGVIKPHFNLVVLIALWTAMTVWGNCVGMFLNGLNIVREQTVLAVVMAVLNLGLSILLVNVMGTVGVILATVLVYAGTTLWITTAMAFRRVRAFSIAS